MKHHFSSFLQQNIKVLTQVQSAVWSTCGLTAVSQFDKDCRLRVWIISVLGGQCSRYFVCREAPRHRPGGQCSFVTLLMVRLYCCRSGLESSGFPRQSGVSIYIQEKRISGYGKRGTSLLGLWLLEFVTILL